MDAYLINEYFYSLQNQLPHIQHQLHFHPLNQFQSFHYQCLPEPLQMPSEQYQQMLLKAS